MSRRQIWKAGARAGDCIFEGARRIGERCVKCANRRLTRWTEDSERIDPAEAEFLGRAVRYMGSHSIKSNEGESWKI
jgi:hypothetical protein